MVDFKKMSELMKAKVSSQDVRKNCIGMLVCPHCGDAVICEHIPPNHVIRSEDVQPECIWCGEHHEGGPENCKTGENNNMIPRGNSSNQSNGNSRGSGKRKGTGLSYLSAGMLSTTHQLTVIEDARVEPDNFNSGNDVVTVKLKLKGEYVLWTLRPNNPNLEALGDAFGNDETTWKGKEIELFLEIDNFNGKSWIRVEPIVESSRATKARK